MPNVPTHVLLSQMLEPNVLLLATNAKCTKACSDKKNIKIVLVLVIRKQIAVQTKMLKAKLQYHKINNKLSYNKKLREGLFL